MNFIIYGYQWNHSIWNADNALLPNGQHLQTNHLWPLFFQAWFTNWIPEWLWMRGATTLNNALRRQAEQRKAPQSLIKRDSSEFDVSKFSWCSQYKDTFNKRENKVTCDKIEEHLFPVICEFFHSGSKPFWISSHPFEQVWSTSEMVQVFRYSGAVAVFISKCCQITSCLLQCILFSVELSFMSIKYVNSLLFLSLENQKWNTSQYLLFFLYLLRTWQIMHCLLKVY